jgi:hypothetical protein
MSEGEMAVDMTEFETTELVEGNVSVEVVGHRESDPETLALDTEPSAVSAAGIELANSVMDTPSPDIIAFIEQSNGNTDFEKIPEQRLVLSSPNLATPTDESATNIVHLRHGSKVAFANDVEREQAA